MLCAVALATACGKKGPPLPPLRRVPVAPAELTAVRHGDTVEIQLTVPAANTDGTRPANIERVDLYAFTGSDLKDQEVFKLEPKLASVKVKAPRDPNQTVEEDESTEDMEPPEGAGLDQGAKAIVQEKLTAASMMPPAGTAKGESDDPNADERPEPLVGPPASVPTRTYVAVGVSTSGRKGSMSRRVRVPLTPAPPPPASPVVTYDETSITVTWVPPAGLGQVQEPAGEGLLPSKPIGPPPPVFTYRVYEAARAASDAPADQTDNAKAGATRLTGAPIPGPTYTDKRITWSVERCYEVRTVQTVDDLAVESDAPPPVCSTPVDTFPPSPPKGLTAVPSEGTVSLIWQPNNETDLGGYLVFRGVDPDKLEPITSAPIPDTTFRDVAASGQRYSYFVKAVDKAGNQSAPSDRVEEAAR